MTNLFRGITWPWNGGRAATVSDAIRILGNNRVFESKKARIVWNCNPIRESVYYPTDVLKRVAKLNNRKKDPFNFSLVYLNGFSLLKMYELVGSNPDRNLSFCPDCKLWIGNFKIGSTIFELSETEKRVLCSSMPSGYYLINVDTLFRNMTHADQLMQVQKLGAEFSIASGAMVAETLCTIFRLTGEEHLAKELHRGEHCNIGYFQNGRLTVVTSDFVRPDIGVVVYIAPFLPLKMAKRSRG